MLKGKWTLFVDQHCNVYGAKTVDELRIQVGGGKVSKMYTDGGGRDAGKTFHVGYVIGNR